MSQPRVTVTYAGNLVDASQIDGKIRFAVDGQAVLSRELRYSGGVQDEPADFSHGITASVHAVSGRSTTGARAVEGDPQDMASPEHTSLLVRAAQACPRFAPATALPPGIHIMCHAEPPADDFDASQRETLAEPDSAIPSPSSGTWSALWEDLKAGTGAAEDAERLAWQEPCLKLVAQAARSLGSGAISSVVRDVAPKGWALVPCAPSSNLVCSLARGGRTGGGGKVAWFHLPQQAAEGAALALTESLLLASGTNREPSYASVLARVEGHDEIEVIAEAHRVLPGGVLSGYDLTWTRPNSRLEPEERLDERTGDPETGVSDARFVDVSAAAAAATADTDADAVRSWRGTVSTEELPGGGLHRHVRLKVDVSCLGHNCGGAKGERHAGHDEWCEVLLAQHVPQGAYIDVDEVKARHDFDISSSLPTKGRVSVETFEGKPIDVELPSSVSGQHVVNMKLVVGTPSKNDGRGRDNRIRADMTLPVHLRYPDPGCERRGDGCDEYAWVEVPPALASVRCGRAGEMGNFYPVLPLAPPVGVALSVPRGMAWHRNFVAWGTVGAAALGCLYTVRTLWVVMSTGIARGSGRNRGSKAHVE